MLLRHYLHLIRRRWRLILIVLSLVLLGGNLVTVIATPSYVSTTRMFVSTNNRASVDPYQAGNFAIQRVSTYANLVKGDELAKAVLSKLNYKLTPDQYLNKVTATAIPETVLLQISATDPDPRKAQRLCETTAVELTQLVRRIETPRGTSNPTATINIVDQASLPENPISPRPLRTAALTGMLGLLLGLAAAGFKESWDSSSDDVARHREPVVRPLETFRRSSL